MTTTAAAATFKEYPEVVDERIDNKFWGILKDSVNLFVKTKPQNEKMHVWINEGNLYTEKSGLKNDSDIGYIFSVPDPRTSDETKNDLKDLVPFLIKHQDESIEIAGDCTLDLDYPDLQDMIFSLFEPASALAPGVRLLPIKKTK